MNHKNRSFVVAVVLVLALFSVPSVEAGSFTGLSNDQDKSWFETAWTWLSTLFVIAEQERSMEAASEATYIKPFPGDDGGTATTSSTGSCIDPMGNPVPCDIRY